MKNKNSTCESEIMEESKASGTPPPSPPPAPPSPTPAPSSPLPATNPVLERQDAVDMKATEEEPAPKKPKKKLSEKQKQTLALGREKKRQKQKQVQPVTTTDPTPVEVQPPEPVKTRPTSPYTTPDDSSDNDYLKSESDEWLSPPRWAPRRNTVSRYLQEEKDEDDDDDWSSREWGNKTLLKQIMEREFPINPFRNRSHVKRIPPTPVVSFI